MSENGNPGCAPSECGTKPACSGCSFNKNEAAKEPASKPQPKVKKVIGVVSGKGGVGKSLVSGALSVMFRRSGLDVALMDASAFTRKPWATTSISIPPSPAAESA